MTNKNSELVIVANRLPIDIENNDDGEISWKMSPGGLVTALDSIIKDQPATWVGWPGKIDYYLDPFTADSITLVPVGLSADEYENYYEGFSNAVLWPLYHDTIVKPDFKRSYWESYVKINKRFAEKVAEVAGLESTVWVQDYQLQLVPGMLRELRPDLKIGFFMHIPFPGMELFQQLPWRKEVVEGMLGSDLIGFQTKDGASNFLQFTKKILGMNVSRANVGIRHNFSNIGFNDRKIKVGAFPISINSSRLDKLANTPAVRRASKDIKKNLGNPKYILFGVDRLDYTKGIDIRLNAIEELIREKKLDPTDIAMVQIATPSRERVEDYKKMRDLIEMKVSRINGVYGSVGNPVVHYIHQSVSREELLAYFKIADVMLVTPLKDGMNLVAKEYIATRRNLSGALVLSEFAGAAQELGKAYLVNPYDLENLKSTILKALYEPVDAKRNRMKSLRRQVLLNNVKIWANSFLKEI